MTMRTITPILVLVLALRACTREVSKAELAAAVKAVGDSIVRQLETFKVKHGRYPTSLTDAQIENRETSLGRFSYELHDPGKDEYFILSVGSYRDNGFSLFWNSDDPQWLMEP